ncbi:MAG: hypothetical protein JSV12_06225 [Candidatus Bathyarchaeota archaeon]|nr:MAG: hypothetical protein JSV12_06225 [Candidatus Bathyarchaeota archaeon]
MTYTVEIKLPDSGNWFKYVPRIDSQEEAENIKCMIEGKLEARVVKK